MAPRCTKKLSQPIACYFKFITNVDKVPIRLKWADFTQRGEAFNRGHWCFLTTKTTKRCESVHRPVSCCDIKIFVYIWTFYWNFWALLFILLLGLLKISADFRENQNLRTVHVKVTISSNTLMVSIQYCIFSLCRCYQKSIF